MRRAQDDSGRSRLDPYAPFILLAFQVLIWLPAALDQGLLLPVSPRSVPPWADAKSPPDRVQDWSGTDKIVFNYPNIVHWVRSVREEPGGLLWNPYNFCGTPFLATLNTHALYPLNFVHLLFGPASGLLISAVLHGWLASLFAFALFRRLALWSSDTSTLKASIASLISGSAFGTCGWFIARQDTFQFVQASTWIPLVLLSIERTIALQSLRWSLLAAIAATLSFLGGMPQVTILGALAAALLAPTAFVRTWKSSSAKAASKGALLCGFAGFLALLLSAPQLLPTYEHAQSTARFHDQGSVSEPAMKPVELLGLVVPELLGSPPELWRRSRPPDSIFPEPVGENRFAPFVLAGLDASNGTHIERLIYPGILSLLLAILALGTKPRASTVLGILLIGTGFGLALETPLRSWLAFIPGLAVGNLRRGIFLAELGFGVLATLGATRLTAANGFWKVFAAALLACVPLALIVAGGIFPASTEDWMRSGTGAAAVVQGSSDWITLKGLSALLAVLGSGLLVVFAPRLRPFALVVPALLLIAADLGFQNTRSNPAQAAMAPFPETRLIKEIRARQALPNGATPLGRVMRFKSDATDLDVAKPYPVALAPNLGLIHQIFDAQGYESLIDRHVEEFMDMIEPGLSVRHHLIRELRNPASLDSPLLDLLGVHDVLSSGPLPLSPTFVDEQELSALFRNEGALPRAFSPKRLRIFDDEASLKSALGSREFRPSEEALILRRDASRLLEQETTEASETVVRIDEFKATRVRVRFDSSGPASILLTDTFHPGWRAHLDDGAEVPIIRANHMFRLVRVPKGSGVVTFEFAPRSFFFGLAGPIVAVLLAIGAQVASRRMRATKERMNPFQDSQLAPSQSAGRAEEIS